MQNEFYRWHIEYSAGGDGCLPEQIDVYRDKDEATAAFMIALADSDDERGPHSISTITLTECNDERCEWCRMAGDSVMPRTYSVEADRDTVAFPLCETCAHDAEVIREIVSDYPDRSCSIREIVLETHNRSERCYWCELLVALDPIGVDSRVSIPMGNRYDFLKQEA
jgi:hypothetical protein